MNDPRPPELDDFAGTVRLFPLPNLVFFPHVMQPLHIFEPRYRRLTEDALAGDRLIALVLPKPGWEADYEGRPAIYPVACVGRVVTEQRLPDGRFNLLLRGLSRLRVVEERNGPEPYRVARAELVAERPVSAAADEVRWRRRLLDRVPDWLHGQAEIAEQFGKLLHGDLGLGPLSDILAFTLPLDVEFKQTLLQEPVVARRLEMLTAHLGAARRPFPPEFSPN